MDLIDSSVTKKALAINLDDSIYGTFAEIGAGQEVARHFFQAGRASHTIAKTMSAYDMTFSDAIYGKEERYVCLPRLLKMLDHEYSLLIERLKSKRGSNTRFFAFADTVSTGSQADDTGTKRTHGWMGVRFQSSPDTEPNDIIMHIRLWDRFRLQQQEALGILGVNLLHAAYFLADHPEQIIHALVDNLSTKRIEVDMIRLSGPKFKKIDNRLMALQLVQHNLTDAVMFAPSGEVVHAPDFLFHQNVLVQRGTYRPITKTNIEILEHGLQQMKLDPLMKGKTPISLLEMTMNILTADGNLDEKDFLNRVDTLAATGNHILISKFTLYYQLKYYLRESTDGLIGLVVGASHLVKMFETKFYEHLQGKILEGFARLFDDKTRIYVFPYKADNQCLTAKTFHPEAKLQHLYRHFLENQSLVDIANCDDINASIHSKDVRQMLAQGNSEWQNLVPPQVREIIQSRKLFGLNSK